MSDKKGPIKEFGRTIAADLRTAKGSWTFYAYCVEVRVGKGNYRRFTEKQKPQEARVKEIRNVR